MSMTNQGDRKRHGLFALGAVVILAGVAALVIWSGDFPVQSLGLLMLVAGVYLVKISNVHGLRDVITRGGKHGQSEVTNRPSSSATNRRLSPAMWAAGIILLLVTGISYFLLHEDAVNGGNQVWPAYLFAATGLACGIFWSYLIARLLGLT